MSNKMRCDGSDGKAEDLGLKGPGFNARMAEKNPILYLTESHSWFN